jgi:hypothetical protein
MIQTELSRLLLRQPASMPALVHDLTDHFTRLWWEADISLPPLGRAYTTSEQAERERCMQAAIDALARLATKEPPRTSDEKRSLRGQIDSHSVELAQALFNLEDRHIQSIRASGFIEAAQAFTRQAQAFDRSLSAEDIFQASRNAWSMNLMQMLMGLPIEVTPAVLAYSLLYPYTDNYLDDPAVPETAKRAFNQRFYHRLAGETVKPANRQEEIISTLVEMIEGQYERSLFPRLYDSLLAIHTAQTKSLTLLRHNTSPYAVDVLGICFEKGGTSVLADGYLVAGSLTSEQMETDYYYGTFTQLVDDLEDIQRDLKDGLMTIFSKTAMHWPLDQVTNKTMNYGAHFLQYLERVSPPEMAGVQEIFNLSIQPLLMMSAGLNNACYSREYIAALEAHFPVRFAFLRKQKRWLERQKFSPLGLIEALVGAQG